MKPSILPATIVALFVAAFVPAGLRAQENYEIQVYGAETIPAGVTMFELHSNFTPLGRRAAEAGVLPTHHQLHETVEITRGFNPWFEVGVYGFTSAAPGQSWRFVGSHVRPRVRAPESWEWPVGASLSMEVGYQGRDFSEDTWSVEIRPIVDKRLGAWYASLNPVLGKSLRGPNAAGGFDFSPNVALNRDVSSTVNLGVEYYGGWGPITALSPPSERTHQLFAVVNLDLGPEWEFNAGVDIGSSALNEKRIVKVILGRRIGPVPRP